MNASGRPQAIAIMGLDGTGKSTLAARLGDEWSRHGRQVRVIHHASTKVSALRALKVRHHAKAVEMLERRNQGSGKGPLALLGVFVRWTLAAYLLSGSLLKSAWYRWFHRKRHLILDRCVLDDVVKVRWRLRIEGRMNSLVMRLAPRPRVVLVLETEPLISFRRKKTHNCTYESYLLKRDILDRTLYEVRAFNWNIQHIDIKELGPDAVLRKVVDIIERMDGSFETEPDGSPTVDPI